MKLQSNVFMWPYNIQLVGIKIWTIFIIYKFGEHLKAENSLQLVLGKLENHLMEIVFNPEIVN